VSPVRYELGLYIPGDGILHSHRHENLYSLLKARFVQYLELKVVARHGTSVMTGPPLWSSGHSSWLLTQRSRVQFPSLPDFLSSSGSGTGFSQPHEVN
jgi:hypothetical protein